MAYRYIDMHCDTLLRINESAELYDCPENMLDIARMARARQGAQFFAVFFPPKTPDSPPDGEAFERSKSLLLDAVETHKDVIGMAFSARDIERNLKDGLCSAVLTIEDGRAVDGDMYKLRRFYDAGVRVMSLTWNASNCFGHSSADPETMRLGLTGFGKEAIEEMNRLGLIIDVSHLSDGGFWDVARLSRKPFAATHSNCRALCRHPRNLSDEMIRALADKGGVVGVNFWPEILAPDGRRESRIEDLCRHATHLMKTGGEDCAGLGTDFDGIDGTFEVGQPADMPKLFEALRQKGMTERQLEKFASGNVLRMMRDAM